VSEQNPEITTPDALPATTPVSQRKTGNPVFGGGLAFDVSTSSQGSESKRLLFDSTMTGYITTNIHCLEAVPPICYLEDRKLHIQLIVRKVLAVPVFFYMSIIS